MSIPQAHDRIPFLSPYAMLFYMTTKYFSLLSAAILSLLVIGAGCNNPAPPNTAPTGSDMFGTLPTTDLASTVPSDIPVYPGGSVIAVTGDTTQLSVAQSTSETGPRLIEWVKQYFSSHGSMLKSTTSNTSGSSTTLVFQGGGKTYEVRVDAPADGSGAFLTVKRTQPSS